MLAALSNNPSRLGKKGSDGTLDGAGSGSVALNEYLKQIGTLGEYDEPFTAAQMVQMFETLHPRMKILPLNSKVRKLVKKVRPLSTFFKEHASQYFSSCPYCIISH